MHLPDLDQVAVVGSGLVGEQLVRMLRERGVKPALATEPIACTLAFLAVPADAAAPLAIDFVNMGATVIDLSEASRGRQDVPLVIPSINGHLLGTRPALIANPNCTATILSIAIAPLRAFGIESVHVSTYQAISGAGQTALAELDTHETSATPVLGEPLQHNVFRHESDVDCTTGHTAEEQKLIQESRTLLDLPHLPIAATCMRVPVRMAHLESITVEISRPSTRDEIAAILAEDSCITVLRDECPTSRNTEGQDDVLVGHIRMNSKTSVSLVAAGDQLRIGAALNAIRIAECLPH
jgi:aspartate-semialdehyde dehydrogenase